MTSFFTALVGLFFLNERGARADTDEMNQPCEPTSDLSLLKWDPAASNLSRRCGSITRARPNPAS